MSETIKSNQDKSKSRIRINTWLVLRVPPIIALRFLWGDRTILNCELQGGVTNILTVGWSVTGVKLKVNNQGFQNLLVTGQTRNSTGNQETKEKWNPESTITSLPKVYGLMLDCTLFCIARTRFSCTLSLVSHSQTLLLSQGAYKLKMISAHSLSKRVLIISNR